MSISKKLTQAAGILPFLKLCVQVLQNGEKKGVKSTGQHRVTYVSDEETTGRDYQTGKTRDEIKYIFEEDGEQKQYRVPKVNDSGELHYFIQRMSEFDEGDELILEYKKQLGSFKGYIRVFRYTGEESVNEEESETEEEIKVKDIPF